MISHRVKKVKNIFQSLTFIQAFRLINQVRPSDQVINILLKNYDLIYLKGTVELISGDPSFKGRDIFELRIQYLVEKNFSTILHSQFKYVS